MTRLDRQVGRVLDLLDELKITDNTLVIFSSDNGPENTHLKPGDKFYSSRGETGGLRGRKRSLLMGGINVPFLVRWPGQVPPGRVDTRSNFNGVDMFPTLLAAAGLDLPENYQGDGENALAAFRGEHFTREKPLFWFWQGKHSGDDWPAWAMRDGDYGFLMDEEEKKIELFNLASDKAQQNNLAKTDPDRVANMKRAVLEWKATLPTRVDPLLISKGKAAARKKAKGKPDRAAAFENKDRDKDGKLTLEEYLFRFPDAEEGKRRFPKFDKDGDGVLSRQEFAFPNK